MFGLGMGELSIILVIALVIFGGKKIRNLGGDLGGAISEFKTSLNDDSEEEKEEESKKEEPKKEEKVSVAATSEKKDAE